MKIIKILIVEDEILIAETIMLYLSERGHEVLDICISYEEAVQAYQLKKPDLVLLDIRLYGEKSGIDFAHFIKNKNDNTPYIFLTSQHDRKTFDLAIETTPYGYLTKPFQKESIWMTIETAYNLYSTKELADTSFSLDDGKNNYVIQLSDIVYLQADHVYINIFTLSNKKITLRKSLTEFLEEIEHAFLVRCHRSFVVNLQHIQEWSNNDIKLQNNFTIPISRTWRDEILLKLRNFT